MSYYYTFGEEREKLLQDLAWLDHVMNERKAILGNFKSGGQRSKRIIPAEVFFKNIRIVLIKGNVQR